MVFCCRRAFSAEPTLYLKRPLGDIFLCGGGQILCKAVQLQAEQHPFHLVIFTARDGAVELGVIFCSAAGHILAHQAHKQLVAEVALQMLQNGNAVARVGRQNQVPHNHASLHNALVVIARRAGLKEHFLNGGRGGVDVVRRVRELLGERIARVFEVRQIHVHQSAEHGERFGRGVAAAVVDDGQLGAINRQTFRHGLNKVVGGHQIDVVNAAFLQHAVAVRQLLGRQRHASAGQRNLVILAVDAAHGAARKKHRTAAARAADTRLLAKVRRDSRHDWQGAHAAKAVAAVLGTHGVAGTRTQITNHKHHRFSENIISIAHFDKISNREIRQIILNNILKVARLDHQLIEQPHQRLG